MSIKFFTLFHKRPKRVFRKSIGVNRKLMAGNIKMCSTPLSISSTTIEYDFNDLEKLLKDRLFEQR